MGYGLDRRSEIGLKKLTPRAAEALGLRLGLRLPPSARARERHERVPVPVVSPDDRSPEETAHLSPRFTPRTKARMAAAKLTASSKARMEAAEAWALQVAAAAAANATRPRVSGLHRPTRHDGRDYLELKQRSEASFAARRRVHARQSMSRPASAQTPRSSRRQEEPLRQMEPERRASSADGSRASLSVTSAAQTTPRSESVATPRMSFRRKEAEHRARETAPVRRERAFEPAAANTVQTPRSETYEAPRLSFRQLEAERKARQTESRTPRSARCEEPRLSFRQMEAERRAHSADGRAALPTPSGLGGSAALQPRPYEPEYTVWLSESNATRANHASAWIQQPVPRLRSEPSLTHGLNGFMRRGLGPPSAWPAWHRGGRFDGLPVTPRIAPRSSAPAYV